MSNLTLGSLFDGSGGFPLAGILCDITPVWASEIEPFPIRVTTKRLPGVKHLGDISKIRGGEITPVDIITFGSPCTDLSVAGKRAGLCGEDSGLFHQAIRIIKEMRESTDGKYPRYIVWENVPGAFSSNKGEDFREVLESVIDIVCKDSKVPSPENGRWPYADVYMGDGWSVAYRVLDAQYFGVPQRRRRIFLVASLGDESAFEILFKREGLPWDSSKSEGKRERTPGYACNRSGAAISFEPGAIARLDGKHSWEESACCLRARMGDNQLAVAIENHPSDGRVKIDEKGQSQTLTSRMGTGGMNVPLVMCERLQSMPITCNLAQTILATDYKGAQCVCEQTPKTLKIRSGCRGGGKGPLVQDNKSATLSCNNDQTLFVKEGGECPVCAKVYCLDRAAFNQGTNAKYGIGIDIELSGTIVAKGPNAVAVPECLCQCQNIEPDAVQTVISETSDSVYTVRRLTPTECASLQGFPKWWCMDLATLEPDENELSFWAEVFETQRRIIGKTEKKKTEKQIRKWLSSPHSDAAEYKMWGNGVALPCVLYVLAGISEYEKTDVTRHHNCVDICV
jgi:DNA (cytosine-5)-methyltransferase 1